MTGEAAIHSRFLFMDDTPEKTTTTAIPAPADTLTKEKATKEKASREWLVWAMLLLAMCLWASAFPAIRVGLRAYSPVNLVALRLIAAAVVLGVYVAVKRMRLPELRDIPRLALTGFLGMTAYQLTLAVGETKITAGSASLLVNTAPVFGAILSWAILKERILLAGWLGMLASFCGAALIAVGESGGDIRLRPEAGIVLISAFTGALYTVLQKPMLARYSGLEFTAYTVWFGALFMLFDLPSLIAVMRHTSLTASLPILYLALFPTSVAYLAWAYALARMPLSKAMSGLYLVPIIAIVVSYLWLHETPTTERALGGAIALGGVVLVNRFGRAH